MIFPTIACVMSLAALTVSVRADTSYTAPPALGGPYPASGAGTSSASAPSKPAGLTPRVGLLTFPVVKQNAQPTYLPPKKAYGAPPKPTTVGESEFTTESFATSLKPEPESENINEFPGEQQQQQQIPDSGFYYVLLPDGRLQKVSYATMPLVQAAGQLQNAPQKEDLPNGYLANVKYQDVEPIKGPIYAYSAAPLVRIYK